jgi:hypothetical protein
VTDPIKQEERTRVCKACGKRISWAARFCPGCGARHVSLAERRARTRREAGRWRLVKGCVVFYMIYLASIVPLFWVPEEHLATGMLVVSLLDAALVIAYWRTSGFEFRPLVRLAGPALKWTAVALAALLPILAVNYAYHSHLLELFDVDAPEIIDPFELAGYAFWVVVVEVCVMPAVWEEIAFRGLIQGKLSKAVGEREALVMTAVLFTIIHRSVISAPYLLALGLVLGGLRRRSGSLVPGMVLHFLHNLGVVVLERWLTA